MMPRTTIMAIEEHNHRCSNSSGGGAGGGSSGSGGGGATSRACKKLKQKKIPQRGLGVAQLERIRLEGEEQHKKDPIFQTPSVLVPKSVPFRPPTMDLPSKNCVFRTNQSALVLDGFRSKTLQSSKSLGELSWSSVSGPGSGDNCPKLWSCEYSPERESQQGNRNRHGVVFGPNVDLPNELHNPILPLPGVLQRSQQYQLSCSSSMMNISSGISSSSSSVLNYQMEPPSNQNYYSCNYVPLWPEEVKMIGMKRPYPFSPEFPPVPAFHCKFPPDYVNLASRSPESASCSNECAASLESGNLLKREIPSGSRTLSESKPRNVVRQNKALNGNFLTLAPPTSNSALQSRDIFILESVTCQGVAEEPTTSSALSRSVEQPIFGFFPTAKVQIDQEGTNKRNCHVEVGGNIDLNLKL
ncbi:uncharacterized protein LOC132031279 [Lycium ferocissimum]|uniref:uncharacterized protein LOC132031279 n=1 Tax=Lycium ferocissimum TaxID=112874 RepID=UPI002815F73A|nr:uncharacterized protein LOC132031279 [Lycium ferocissimum]